MRGLGWRQCALLSPVTATSWGYTSFLRGGGGGVTRHPQTLGTWETFQLVKSEYSAQNVPHVLVQGSPHPHAGGGGGGVLAVFVSWKHKARAGPTPASSIWDARRWSDAHIPQQVHVTQWLSNGQWLAGAGIHHSDLSVHCPRDLILGRRCTRH